MDVGTGDVTTDRAPRTAEPTVVDEVDEVDEVDDIDEVDDVAIDAASPAERRRSARRARRREAQVREQDEHVYVRSPVFVTRLIVAAAVLAALAVTPVVFDQAVDGLRADLTELVRGASASLARFIDAAGIVACATIVAGSLVASTLRRTARASLVMVVAASTAVVAVLIFERWAGTATDHEHVLAIAGIGAAAAVLTTQVGPRTSHLRRFGWVVVTIVVVVGAPWDIVGVPGRLEALFAGILAGAATALVLRTETMAATPRTLRRALAAAGIPVVAMEEHGGDARGSRPWLVRLETGRSLFVKTYSDEERSADLLFRAWRFLGLRVEDERPESSLRGAVEHEALLGTRAGLVGVRAPRFISMGPIGESGLFAAYSCVDGRTFAEVGQELSEPTLRATWSMLVALHRAGIAHRDLRTANLMVDADGEPWIVDFAFGQMAATDDQMRLDVVELLCSLAAAVGDERAVATAHAVLGREVLSDALPYIQPLATSAATRRALGKSGFTSLRDAVRAATGVAEPELPPLSTIRPKTVLSVVGFGIAVWVLLSQVTHAGDLFERLADASTGWIVVAVVASATTYVGAALSIMGSVPSEVPFLPAFGSQLASSFVNRVTPAQVGGAVLNVRWLVKEGNDSATATTAIGINSLAGAVVHIALALIAIVWAGTGGLEGVQLPEARTMLVVALLLVVVVGGGWSLPSVRRRFRHKVRPRLLQSWQAVVSLSRQPTKIAMAFGGSLIVTLSYLVALTAALQAFGAAPSLSAIAVVYLAGSALASAAPTPSGLGATEAILAAGFAATGVEQGIAVASVLLFRGATFWLPIVPGWIAFVTLQRAERI